MTSSNIILRLGSREYEVFELRKQGFSAKEIAEKLEISYRTVESHIAGIMNKGGFCKFIDLITFEGEIVVCRKPVMKNSQKCKIIEEGLLQKKTDKEIMSILNVSRQTYGMLKRLVLNEPEIKRKLDEMNTPKPMFRWLHYA